MNIVESTMSIPTLQYHDEMNIAIWDADKKMKPDVRDALLRVADNFIESLNPFIDSSMISDVCLTGSNANFNYTSGSDLDLHILIRFPKEKIYEDFAQAKKTTWNTTYKVSIHGFPVEIYPQNADENVVKGSGWYSITHDKWLTEPIHQNNVDVTNPEIINIANKLARQIDFVIDYKVTDLPVLHRLGETIWGLRDQAKNGEFSIRNLAFKELRNNGYTDKYIKYAQTVQAQHLSIK